jgi:transcriptional regulator with XRE-family HTH domain
MSDLKPTIENPFATTARPTYTRPQAVQPLPQQRIAKPSDETSLRPEDMLPDPGFYCSMATKRYLAGLLADKTITQEELPFLYTLFKRVAELFGRSAPTFSDVEIGLKFRTKERIEAIANGTESIDVQRFDKSTLNVMSKAQQKKYWQEGAAELLRMETEEQAATKPQPAV